MVYVKRPVKIEAFRLGIDYIPDWFMDKVKINDIILRNTLYGTRTCADIHTLEGVMHANYGDFIIKGVKGEIYPCKPDIFYATYDEFEGSVISNLEDTIACLKVELELRERDTAKRIFEELETVLCTTVTPTIVNGEIKTVRLEELRIRPEDYFAIKRRFTEVPNAQDT